MENQCRANSKVVRKLLFRESTGKLATRRKRDKRKRALCDARFDGLAFPEMVGG